MSKKAVLLIDFGSTYTKLTAVDVEKESILATAQSPTTVQTNINDGYQKALTKIIDQTGPLDFIDQLACSSARGGFKMVVIGLTKSLTTEAAKRAALGAGARILKVYAPELSEKDILEIDELEPDVILLAGGTDGGNQDYLIKNARKLVTLKTTLPIVIAGNQNAYPVISEIFQTAQHPEYYMTENVMPKTNVLQVEAVREILRKIFMEKIVEAKGYEAATENVGKIILPTPTAVLQAAKVLAEGTPNEAGVSDLAIVDIGGATTDVHSISKAQPEIYGDVIFEGLPEPYAKRTVEGDLGMRYSAMSLYEAVGEAEIARFAPENMPIFETCAYLESHPDYVPTTTDEKNFDVALAKCAVKKSIERHAGNFRKVATPTRYIYYQTGKDMRNLKAIIGTGGVLYHSVDPKAVLAACLDNEDVSKLMPKNPKLYLDRDYILSAMGLLSTDYPDVALRMMKKHIQLLN